MKYIGSHYGNINDNYKFSGLDIKKAYNKNPNDFYREILSYHLVKSTKELREIEDKYLKDNNVAKSKMFYNRTDNAYGGAIPTEIIEKYKQTFDENGLTIYQKSAIKMVNTRKNNNSYKTGSIKGANTKSKYKNEINQTISNKMLGCKIMNNGAIQKQIMKTDIDEYLKLGWVLGMLNNIRINKDNITKYCNKSNLQSYIIDGWNYNKKVKCVDIFVSYNRAKMIINDNDIKTAREYKKFRQKYQLKYLPSHPENFYKDWLSWSDFLK
jgi:hypothetical protein